MKLSELKTGESGLIVKISGRSAFRRRIASMGFIRGKAVQVVRNAPLKDPIHYRIMNYDVSLRRNDASLVEIIKSTDCAEISADLADATICSDDTCQEDLRNIALKRGKTINVALIGNPNSGKTSLFNCAVGAHEHVGNYSGVTVDAKKAEFKQNGYTFNLIDLPGTYSLSSSNAEEKYVRNYLDHMYPDVIINVVDASNLERNLYLTCQLIDMDWHTVVALNMFDTLKESADGLDYQMLSRMLGIPMTPTNGRSGKGLKELFDHVIQVYEGTDPVMRHVHINYGRQLETGITQVKDALLENGEIEDSQSKRYLAIKLLERDAEAENYIRQLPSREQIFRKRDKSITQIETFFQTDSETAFVDARYGFISGALRETFTPAKDTDISNTRIVDAFIMHKVLGFPIFLLFMWIMFEATFRLGQYPMNWIETLVELVSRFVHTHVADGVLKDLLTDGVINGVGGVIVFLPNIMILYAFISVMEDSGYMARAAFIMDRLMHKMGLHGKSFISLIMGFGCNVPAILSSRTIESRNSRILTMLVTPLMSCSARLPVYLLFTGSFFAGNAGLVLFILYASGILLAVVLARLFKRFFFKEEDVPFVMELPPYRMPTIRTTLIHMWDKAQQYLRKMGGIILSASIIIWFLGYFPRQEALQTQCEQQIAVIEQSASSQEEKESEITELKRVQRIEQQKNSYIGRIGHAIQPVLRPLGFDDWKIGVGLLTGMVAKEVVISTLSVLYTGEDTDEVQLSRRLKESTNDTGKPVFTPLLALCLMFFVLIYFPCISSITAIIKESDSWKWGVFVIGYTCLLAWCVSFVIYNIGGLFV